MEKSNILLFMKGKSIPESVFLVGLCETFLDEETENTERYSYINGFRNKKRDRNKKKMVVVFLYT